VLWAVNLGCLGFHVWPYLAADPDHTDELRIDLDPTPGVDFRHIRQAGHELRKLYTELGITAYPKTTGNRGLHVYVRLAPRWDSYQVRSAAVATARELERRRPDLITAAWWKEERGARVFVDYNQNAPHKTVFGAWSVRARPGAQVSTPITWEELDHIHPDQFTIASMADRLAAVDDPWLGMNGPRQRSAPPGFARLPGPWCARGFYPTLLGANAGGGRPQAAAVSSLAQYLHLVAETGMSADWQRGQVLVGGGSPKTDLPRRAI